MWKDAKNIGNPERQCKGPQAGVSLCSRNSPMARRAKVTKDVRSTTQGLSSPPSITSASKDETTEE